MAKNSEVAYEVLYCHENLQIKCFFCCATFFVRLVCICQIGENKETIPLIKETNNPTEVKKIVSITVFVCINPISAGEGQKASPPFLPVFFPCNFYKRRN